MLRLYNGALFPLRGMARLRAAWAGRAGRAHREWDERLAKRLPEAPPQGLWLHGASVGEARVVGFVCAQVRRGRPDLSLSVSALTPSGRAQLPAPPAVDAAFFLPLDFAGLPGRVLGALRPRALVLVETEIWPNLLHETASRCVAAAVVNGRLSPERMARYRALRALYHPLLRDLALVCAQTSHEAERFTTLGARTEAVRVTGNVKYDLPAPSVDPAELRARFGLGPTRPVVVAGSTGEGEEQPVLEAFLEARKSTRSLFLVLAPRHTERAGTVATEAAKLGVRLHRLSCRDDAEAGLTDGLLVDTLGELADLYVLASAAFVGGSLVPVGGHNVLEPAAAGVPVLFGRHTHHVAEPAAALEQAGGALRISDGRSLGEAWKEILGDDARRGRMARAAQEVVRSHRGALDRTVGAILDLVDRTPGDGA